MASAAAHDFPQDPVKAHEVSRVQYVSIAMEDVMQQVVENQMGHHRAIRERHGIEMVGSPPLYLKWKCGCWCGKGLTKYHYWARWKPSDRCPMRNTEP
mmetsp:Transcript_30987/g.82342  ORF Transcript_30987/g.82342 Transcript_30987/m.82342 type:complete len:98 (+) Transcript_30987:235-528(+)